MKIMLLSFALLPVLFSCSSGAKDRPDKAFVPESLEDPELVEDYLGYLELVDREEAYTGFLAAEKNCMTTMDEDYKLERYNYIVESVNTKPENGNPAPTSNKFIDICREKGYLCSGKEAETFEKSVRILTLELYSDHPSFPVATENVKLVPDLVYAVYPNKELKLDLFLPEKPLSEKVPCIVCIHGGGWRMHRKAWFSPHAAWFASHGIAAVTINYRLLPAVTPVECVMDAKAAVRWVRAHAEEYGIDGNRIGAIGGSAGAHMAAMLATSGGIKELEGQGGNNEVSSRIQAGVGFATPAIIQPRENVPALVSPFRYISGESAPFLFIHGTADKAVNPSDSKDMYEKYLAEGAHAEIIMLEGQPHVFYTAEPAVEMAWEFFQRQFKLKNE